MAKQKEEVHATHDSFKVVNTKVIKSEASHDSESVEILIPKGMPYVKIRKALEIALLRIR